MLLPCWRWWITRQFESAGTPKRRARRVPRGKSRSRPRLERLEDRLNPAPALLTTLEGINFDEDGANNASFPFGSIPPDPIGGAGPNHVVSVVNTSIEWHTKAGVQQNSQRLGADFNGSFVGSFFEPLTPANSLFDPKVVYDQFANRFVVVALEQVKEVAFPQPVLASRILVAVSDDSDPNGTWFTTAINSLMDIGGVDAWADFPGLATDEEAVYITTNMVSFGIFGPPPAFQGSRLWIIDKEVGTGFYSGGTASVTVHDPYTAVGLPAVGMQPAQVYGTAPAGVGTWLVEMGFTLGADDFLSIIRVDNPLNPTPTFTQQFLNTGDIDNTALPGPDAPQLGTTALIDAGPRRVLNTVWRDNSLWIGGTVLPGSGPDAGQATAHWWEVDTSTPGALTLADQGNVGAEDLGTGTHTYYPSIAVDSAGNMAMGFAASSPTMFAGAFYTGRLTGDPAGTVQPTGTLAAGLDSYVRTYGSGRNRWGDYSGIAIDPSNDTTFWVFNEYALTRGNPDITGEDGRWSTRWGSFSLVPNTPPSISDITDQITDEDIPTGAVTFNVGDVETPAGSLTVTGSSSNPLLVADANIVFGGSGANRTVTVTPAANQFGSVIITVTVSDGNGGTASDPFVLTVNAVNDVVLFDVQPGAGQRSFIRFLDLTFEQMDGVADLITESRVRLTRFGLDGSGGSPVDLTGRLSTSGAVLTFDFGSQGIGGNRNANVGDGYYAATLDLDRDGTFETTRNFYRLLGDVNGDRLVNALDANAILAAYGLTGSNLNEDVNGDGVVNALDRIFAIRALGRALANGLLLDD